ncbi:extracellular solute-binding protein [Pelagibacterium sp. H642]|uniref:extracellular solute-binding protein n=1 Tax=Pelagibacterium sp. H642 TaxID=1881069 RepID=UPI00281584FE|nr:extracellular solute-binding protein [Pelagibacterium sp. H642]WMT92656.1 extracellular solute-binding protein [Pelagibacterium sp. H642]
MIKKLHNRLAASLMVLLSSTAAAQAEVTVEFWHSFGGSSGEALADIIENFEAANPDINIEAEHVGNYEDIVTRLQAAIPARRAPDAVILEVTRYGLFADRGALIDLTSYLDADPLGDDLYDFAREVGVYEGKNYIIPFNSSTPVLYYNRDILERAGITEEPDLETFADVERVAQQVQDALGDQGVFGIAAPGQFARWGLVMGNDSNLIMFNSTGNYGDAFSALGEDLAVRPMPCNKTCSVPIGGAGIGILASAEKEVQDAAYQFISFAASAQSNAAWFSATGYMPINRNTPDQPLAIQALAENPGIDTAINQLDFAQGRPRPPVVTWMRTGEYDIWEAVALGQREVREALSDFADRTRAEADRLAR